MAKKSIPVKTTRLDTLRAREDRAIYSAMRILEERLGQPGELLNCPEAVGRLAALRLGGRERETFAVFFLTAQHRLIAFEEIFHGSIDSAAIVPREVVKMALVHNAAATIFAHNHPSGEATPSHADWQMTNHLKEVLRLVDVRVIDHIVVGGTNTRSMAELDFRFFDNNLEMVKPSKTVKPSRQAVRRSKS